MIIEYLSNKPEKINDVSSMIFNEFVLKSGSIKTFEEVKEFFSKTKKEDFPITLVALENERCIGTISIFENDLRIREHYKPWLASLYVEPMYRSNGVAKMLINKTIEVVKELGYKEFYLRTEDASEYYRKQGWYLIETVSDEKYAKIDLFQLTIENE